MKIKCFKIVCIVKGIDYMYFKVLKCQVYRVKVQNVKKKRLK